MESDAALSLWSVRSRARALGSRTLMDRVRPPAAAQARYARAARERAQVQVDRNVNQWPAQRGLVGASGDRTNDDVLALVLDAAGALFDGCASVSLTLVDQLGGDEHPYRTAVATGLAGQVDAAQYRLGEGPCIDALELDMLAVVTADDLAAPDQQRSWPRLCRAADELGVRSAVSVAVPWSALRVGVHPARRSLGAINFYAREPRAFGRSEHLGMLLGCWAGGLLSSKAPAEILHAGG